MICIFFQRFGPSIFFFHIKHYYDRYVCHCINRCRGIRNVTSSHHDPLTILPSVSRNQNILYMRHCHSRQVRATNDSVGCGTAFNAGLTSDQRQNALASLKQPCSRRGVGMSWTPSVSISVVCCVVDTSTFNVSYCWTRNRQAGRQAGGSRRDAVS